MGTTPALNRARIVRICTNQGRMFRTRNPRAGFVRRVAKIGFCYFRNHTSGRQPHLIRSSPPIPIGGRFGKMSRESGVIELRPRLRCLLSTTAARRQLPSGIPARRHLACGDSANRTLGKLLTPQPEAWQGSPRILVAILRIATGVLLIRIAYGPFGAAAKPVPDEASFQLRLTAILRSTWDGRSVGTLLCHQGRLDDAGRLMYLNTSDLRFAAMRHLRSGQLFDPLAAAR